MAYDPALIRNLRIALETVPGVEGIAKVAVSSDLGDQVIAVLVPPDGTP